MRTICLTLAILAAWTHAATVPVDTGLAVWLKADALAMTNNQKFNIGDTWADSSAAGRDAVLVDGGPTYYTNKVNGLPAVGFGGGAAFEFAGSLGISGQAAFTGFAVVIQNNTSNNQRVLQFGDIDTGTGGASVGLDTNSAGLRFNNGNRLFSPAVDTASFHVAMWQMTATDTYGTSSYALDGTNGTQTSVSGASNTTNVVDEGYILGRGYTGSGKADWLNAQVAEVLLYDSALSQAQIDQVGYYLARKYNLPTSHAAPSLVTFDGAGADTDWSTQENWDATAEPTASQDALIASGQAATVSKSGETAKDLSFADNTASLSVTNGSLTVNAITGGQGTIRFTGGSIAVTTGNVDVNEFLIANRTYTHDAGTFQAGTLTLGDTAGEGDVQQNGGTVHVTGDLNYGPGGNKGGEYYLNAGTLQVDGSIVETVEAVSPAQMFVDGGTLQVTGSITLQSFRVGNAAGTTGSYTLPAGQVINNTGTLFVGNNGTGELTVNDTSCQITVKNSLRVAAAESANSGDGTLNFQAGTIDVTGGGMYLGGQDAASNESNTIGRVVMGTSGGNLADAQLFTSGANLEVGRGGTGYFTQDSGTVTVKTNNVVIGQAASAVGTYTMNGGKLVLQATGTNGSIRVGNTGAGTFIQNGGEVVANIVDLANVDTATSIGTYTMNGGTLTTGGMLVIGRENQGTFEAVGGTINIGGSLLVGGTDTTGANDAPNADGTMVIGSATTSPVLNLGQFEIGRHNVGMVTQNSGTVSVNGDYNLVLSQYANGNGTYNMAGGELILGTGSNGNINFNQGTGLFDQTGGLVTFTGGSVRLGNNPTSQSTYKLRGGTLDLGGGDVAVGSGNETFEFSGGRLMKPVQFNMPMNQLGGTLAPGGSIGKTIITGAYDQSSGATLEIELDGLAGPGVAGGNDVLQVNQGVTLAGILDVLVNFPAPENAVFQILLANGSGPISGTFQTPDGLELTEGTIFYGTGQGRNPFLITYVGGDGNDVTLTVVPEPASALLLLLSLPAVATRLRRRGLARRPR